MKLHATPPTGLETTPQLHWQPLKAGNRRLHPVASGKVRPYYARMLANRGRYLTLTGHLLEARERLAEALELEPGDSHSHQFLGDLELRLGDLAAARSAYAMSVRLDGDNAEARRGLSAVERLMTRR
jgi:tetratricopeptide (TPR) repeat protein